jgi:N-carbamoylputrescine amidase
MKIALVQQHATHDRQANLQRGLQAAQEASAQGAQVICFAELAFDRFLPQVPATPDTLARAEPIPGPTTEAFQKIASDNKIVIVLNLFERAGGLTFDSSPVIDADGTLLGITRMVHITEYEFFHEQGFYSPGDNKIVVFDTRHGKIGVAICYDRHYPEYMRALAVAGADLVVVPQAGSVGEWPDGLYEAEMQVAAFQNGYFTALCNRVGEEENLTFAGESFVCGPDGRILARAAEGKDEILYCDIDLKECAGSHARKLFMRDRRPELYADWLGKATT